MFGVCRLSSEFHTPLVSDIVDIPRTFPHNMYFKDDKDPTSLIACLRRVLCCFAIQNPSIGYCQVSPQATVLEIHPAMICNQRQRLMHSLSLISVSYYDLPIACVRELIIAKHSVIQNQITPQICLLELRRYRGVSE